MGDKSKIEWTDATWNPVTGCTKVSAGCKNCYAERLFPRVYPGRKFSDVVLHHDRLGQPLRWKKPRRVFVNSMSDLFHPDVMYWFIDAVFDTMATAEQHVFQVLTKRPSTMLDYFRRESQERYILHNVMLGISAENQRALDKRVPQLLKTPASTRFISCEPLLEPVHYDWTGIDWVIVGGESGPKARPMDPDWARSIRDQCREAGVPFFMKQMAKKAPIPGDLLMREYPK